MAGVIDPDREGFLRLATQIEKAFCM